MIKLPEPEGRICFDGGEWEDDWVSCADAYSEEQMLQFRRDALEDVAQQIDVLANEVSNGNFLAIRERQLCAKYIRSLKETNVITF